MSTTPPTGRSAPPSGPLAALAGVLHRATAVANVRLLVTVHRTRAPGQTLRLGARLRADVVGTERTGAGYTVILSLRTTDVRAFLAAHAPVLLAESTARMP